MIVRLPFAKTTPHAIRPFRRYGRFLVVGMMNALVDIIVFNVLVILMPSPSPWLMSLFNTFAVAAAILNSYIWNRHWTFADVSSGTSAEKRRFVAQALFNIFLNDLTVFLVATYLTHVKSLSPYTGGNLSKGLAMFISSTVSYLILQRFVFRKIPSKPIRPVASNEMQPGRHTGSKHRKWLTVASWGTAIGAFGGFFALWQTIAMEAAKPSNQPTATMKPTSGSVGQPGGQHHHHRQSDNGKSSAGDSGSAVAGGFGGSTFGGSGSDSGSAFGGAGAGGSVTVGGTGSSDFTSGAS